MSKAFTKESDGDPGPEPIPEPKDPLPPGARNYVTPKGARALKDELRHLDREIRPKLVAASRRRKSSEPSSRKELEEVERRVRFLEGRLSKMLVVDPAEQDPETVHFGARVLVSNDDGVEKAYQIVGVDESDPAVGRVSWISPVAKALLSARVGDVVVLELPDGREELEILRIHYGDPD